MAFVIRNPIAGSQPIATNSTTQKHPLGTIVVADDPVYGGGEFIYLKGVASTIVGSWVTYDQDDFSTALIVADAVGPVGVAMSACVANEYGWYQISGKANADAADVTDTGTDLVARVFTDTVAGQCDNAFSAGNQVLNARWASKDDTATGRADVELWRPYVSDGQGSEDTA